MELVAIFFNYIPYRTQNTMLDLLSEYLNRATNPEEKLVIERACQVLEDIGQENFEDVIEEILNTDDEVDAGATLQSINDLLRALLYRILQQHAIVIVEDCSLALLADFVQGIMVLDNYDNRQELVAATNSQAPVREVFCEIMQMVTKHTVEELMPYVEEISDAFLARLKSNNGGDSLDVADNLEEQRERIHAFKVYDILLAPEGGAPSQLTAMLRAGMSVALPFLLYAKTIPVPFEQLPSKAIAREMFGMALISSDGYDRPGDTVKEHIEEFISSPEVIVAAMAEVRLLTLGYQP